MKSYDQDCKDLDSISTSSGSTNSFQIAVSESGREMSKFFQIQHGMPKWLKSLQVSDISDVIRFFPILMTHLFRLLIITTCDDVSQSIVKTILIILRNIHAVNKEVISSYVEVGYVTTFMLISFQVCNFFVSQKNLTHSF